MTQTIAFQGLLGAYSDLACRAAYPGWQTLPCPSFEAAMDAVRSDAAQLAMLPCENSLAGRVPDIHRLLPESGLSVVGEHFERVEHCLLAPQGATLASLKRAHSHPVALGQVRNILRDLNLVPVIEADTGPIQALAKVAVFKDAVAMTVTMPPPRARDCAAIVIFEEPSALARAAMVFPEALIILAPLKSALVTVLAI